jgi:hypothetical protein
MALPYKCFVSELMDLLLAGEDQPQADQPNNLDKVTPCKFRSRENFTAYVTFLIFLFNPFLIGLLLL